MSMFYKRELHTLLFFFPSCFALRKRTVKVMSLALFLGREGVYCEVHSLEVEMVPPVR